MKVAHPIESLSSSHRADVVQQVLNVVSSVTMTPAEGASEVSQLVEDLGVESIDLLDIFYQLEDAFSVDFGGLPVFLDRAFLESEAGNIKDGRLTKAGWDRLAPYPYLRRPRLEADNVGAYLGSVGALVDLVMDRLLRGPALDSADAHS